MGKWFYRRYRDLIVWTPQNLTPSRRLRKRKNNRPKENDEQSPSSASTQTMRSKGPSYEAKPDSKSPERHQPENNFANGKGARGASTPQVSHRIREWNGGRRN